MPDAGSAAGSDQTVTTNSAGGQGFTGIMVAWLGKFNPLFMILTAALIQILNQGASQISQDFGVNNALPNVIVGIVLFFIIGSEFFINYEIHFRKNAKLSETASAIPEMIPEVEGTEGPAVPAADEIAEAAAEPEAPAAGKEA